MRARAEDIREMDGKAAEAGIADKDPKLDRDQALSLASKMYKLKGLPPVSLYETCTPKDGDSGVGCGRMLSASVVDAPCTLGTLRRVIRNRGAVLTFMCRQEM